MQVWKNCGSDGNRTIELVIGQKSVSGSLAWPSLPSTTNPPSVPVPRLPRAPTLQGHEWPGIWPFDFQWSATSYLLDWFGIHVVRD